MFTSNLKVRDVNFLSYTLIAIKGNAISIFLLSSDISTFVACEITHQM